MSDAERAVEKLYEDTAVRDELRDDQAEKLLRWGEAQIQRLADDPQFEERMTTLHQLLKGVNRLIGQRADLEAETRRKRLADMAALGRALGVEVSETQVDDLLGTFDSLDDDGAVQALTTLFDSTPKPADPLARPGLSDPLSRSPRPDLPDPLNLTHKPTSGDS